MAPLNVQPVAVRCLLERQCDFVFVFVFFFFFHLAIIKSKWNELQLFWLWKIFDNVCNVTAATVGRCFRRFENLWTRTMRKLFSACFSRREISTMKKKETILCTRASGIYYESISPFEKWNVAISRMWSEQNTNWRSKCVWFHRQSTLSIFKSKCAAQFYDHRQCIKCKNKWKK